MARHTKTRASGRPVACVIDLSAKVTKHGFKHGQILRKLKEICARRGWPMLVLDNTNQTEQTIIDRIRSARAFGAILDSHSATLIRLLKEEGTPAVAMDSWVWDSWTDSVVQDAQMGGMQAVEYLVSRGNRRIAWFGNLVKSAHGIDRLSGVVAGLNVQGLELPPSRRIHAEEGQEKAVARKLLSRRDRPDGVIALWQNYALSVKKAADELGLSLGRDFEMVGWSTEESFKAVYCAAFKDDVPPAITWSVQAMAETALSRLAERRGHPDLPAVRIKIPTRLTFVE